MVSIIAQLVVTNKFCCFTFLSWFQILVGTDRNDLPDSALSKENEGFYFYLFIYLLTRKRKQSLEQTEKTDRFAPPHIYTQ